MHSTPLIMLFSFQLLKANPKFFVLAAHETSCMTSSMNRLRQCLSLYSIWWQINSRALPLKPQEQWARDHGSFPFPLNLSLEVGSIRILTFLALLLGGNGFYLCRALPWQ
ncbi:hypothetical protein NPIL_411331 [Nephila pilipes]|uniref:Uncharacterized protein n=1 Tax=Nephila pilipes TaxID=299642 RepID=A0A8X6IMI6_NEPPI|nr:hypothetical protein NPIL_411331 [Nephila pilipes]